ncbi:MAG TPA: hypothetical protein VHC47_00290 [Mucilaginibacter sp.]|nr:hypothetical protein [Mucilaginibacter sp.]
MRIFVFILRTALGLFFLLYGIDYFYHIKYLPPIVLSTKEATGFINILAKTGYILPAVYGTEIACGFFLVINRYAPLFLIILMPITVNIFLFLYFYQDDNVYIGYSALGLNLLLMLIYRKAYTHLFNRRGRFASFRLLVNVAPPEEKE